MICLEYTARKWKCELLRCVRLCNPMDCSLPDSSVHWILQAGILERVAISFFRGSFLPRNQTQVILYCLSHQGSPSKCCCSITNSCLTLCDPMDCSMPGFPVLHYLLELAQTQVHWGGNVIQPSHLPLPPSSPTFNLSQHQNLFQWVGSLHQVSGQSIGAPTSASVLPMNIQGWFP